MVTGVALTAVPDSVLWCMQASAGSGLSPRPSAGKGRAGLNIERRSSAEDVVAAYQVRDRRVESP